MSWKRRMSKSFARTSRAIKEVNKPLRRLSRETRSAIKGAHKPVQRSLMRAIAKTSDPIDRIVERVGTQARSIIESQIERVGEQAKDIIEAQLASGTEKLRRSVDAEVRRLVPLLIYIFIGAVFGIIGIVLMAVFLVHFLAQVAQLPSWAAYLIPGISFVVVSLILFRRGVAMY